MSKFKKQVKEDQIWLMLTQAALLLHNKGHIQLFHQLIDIRNEFDDQISLAKRNTGQDAEQISMTGHQDYSHELKKRFLEVIENENGDLERA